ncbi:MAG TPA: transketolase [Candidatus Limnocylindria bacterium]
MTAGAGTVNRAEVERLEEMARRIRVEIIRTVNHAQVGHVGGPLSAADILAALYFRVLRIRPDEPAWPDRDRFILSKGHSSLVQYSAMALRGYFGVDELRTFDSQGSRLQGHPDMKLLPGIDMSTGSLGMGLSAGLGMALGARFAGRDVRTFVLLGDGECQEGQVWEAAMVAARYRVDRLVAIVDHNKLQQYGWPGETADVRLPPEEPGELLAKWGAFGWRVIEADGHDMARVVAALEEASVPEGRPSVVIAHTVKGHGVSFMEGDYRWHSKPIKPEEFAAAMRELGEVEE